MSTESAQEPAKRIESPQEPAKGISIYHSHILEGLKRAEEEISLDGANSSCCMDYSNATTVVKSLRDLVEMYIESGRTIQEHPFLFEVIQGNIPFFVTQGRGQNRFSIKREIYFHLPEPPHYQKRMRLLG